jgi:hypothetical protein
VQARELPFAFGAFALLALAGCGPAGPVAEVNPPETLIPLSVGPGPHFRPAPGARPVAGLRCRPGSRERAGAHLELFARRRVVLVPAGIGVAPPRVRDGARVRGGRCRYPAATVDPTGVIEIDVGRRLSLGQFFAVWGRPLGTRRLLSWRGRPVLAFVNGRRHRGDPRGIPLRRHAQVVLEVRGYVPPHRVYRYPPGL